MDIAKDYVLRDAQAGVKGNVKAAVRCHLILYNYACPTYYAKGYVKDKTL